MLRYPIFSALTGILIGVSAVVGADPIVNRVGVLSRLIFTDNLYLSQEGKESDVILQLTPNISGGRTGNRASYRFYWGPSALIYGGDNSDLSRVVNILQADAAVDLIDEYLGLRMTARANQYLLDPGETPVGFDALGNPDAFTQVGGIEITPVIRLPLLRSDFATVRIEPGINYVFSTDTSGGEGRQGNLGSRSSVTVASGEQFSRSKWSLNWVGESFNTESEANQQSLFATFGYRLDRRWAIEGLAGYDSADYLTTQDTAGPRWRLTPVWTPSQNTTLGIGYGERYYGSDWYLRYNHAFKKARVALEYETTVTDAKSQLFRDDIVEFEDPFGNAILDPLSNQDLSGSVTNAALVDSVIVQTRGRGRFSYRHGRTNFDATLWRDERSYQATDARYFDWYGNFLLRRQLNPRSDASVILNLWRHEEGDSNPIDYDQLRASIQFSYRLSRQTATAVRYSYLTRVSDSDPQDYDENRLYLTLNWTL